MVDLGNGVTNIDGIFYQNGRIMTTEEVLAEINTRTFCSKTLEVEDESGKLQ